MKQLTINHMNEIERYGKRISVIDKHLAIPERHCCYYYNGVFHIFVKKLGLPVKYRTTKNW